MVPSLSTDPLLRLEILDWRELKPDFNFSGMRL